VDKVIITGTNISNTTDKATTTSISCRVDLHLWDATMALAAMVATMEEVAVMESVLILFAALPGTKPSSALRHAKH